MKKTTLLIAILSLLNLVSAAQNNTIRQRRIMTGSAEPIELFFGPKIGGNYSFLSTTDINSQAVPQPGLLIGGFGEIKVNRWFSATIDVLYSSTCFKLNKDLTILHNIIAPVMANFYVWNGLAVKAGFQVGFMATANELPFEGKLINVSERFHTFEMSIPVGLSYTFNNGLVIDARYQIGVLEMLKNSPFENRCSVLSLSLGLKF